MTRLRSNGASGTLEASEPLLERALLVAGDRHQQRVGYVLADGRGGLEELLVLGGQPIDP